MKKIVLALMVLIFLMSVGFAEETAEGENTADETAAAEEVASDSPVGGWVLDTVDVLDNQGNVKETVTDAFGELGYNESLMFGENGTFRSSYETFTFSTGVIGQWEKDGETIAVKDGFDTDYTYTIGDNAIKRSLEGEIRTYKRSEEVALILVSKPELTETLNADACLGLWKLSYYTASENGILVSVGDVNIGSFALCMASDRIWVLEYDSQANGYIINEEKVPVYDGSIVRTQDEKGNPSDAFTVQLCDNGWMLVMENGTAMYFEKIETNQSAANDKQVGPGGESGLNFKQMSTKKAGVNIRKEPDKKAELVVSLKKKGEKVIVLTQKKNKSGETWYLVYSDEGSGYLRNDMVK